MLYVSKGWNEEDYFNIDNPSSNEVRNRKQRIDRNRLYWICQISGWSFYALINISVITALDSFNWGKSLLAVFLCFTGLWFTNYYHIYIKRKNWVELTLKKLIPRVSASSILMGTVLFLLFFLLDSLLKIYEPERLQPPSILIGIVNLSSVMLLWSLIYFAFNYFENYKKAEIESLIWENAVKEFELRTLRAQLNPHFMFNALNSIRALIKEEPLNAQTAVTKLSNILRYSLKIERTELVPLIEEIRAVADYLALEKMRFEERLKYVIKVDPQSERIEIPPMMIQTLVENGIKHGVSRRTEGGTISIETDLSNSKVHIKIITSGQINSNELKVSTGFGINNTKHRLNLIYGENAKFTISNHNEKEVLAELVIPTGGTKNESLNSR
jgi:two-component system LytT family sensor kinase